jgi:hypothetical protein
MPPISWPPAGTGAASQRANSALPTSRARSGSLTGDAFLIRLRNQGAERIARYSPARAAAVTSPSKRIQGFTCDDRMKMIGA